MFTVSGRNKKPQLSLRNPRDVMLPAVACTVCEIFAFELYRVTLKLVVGVTQGHRKYNLSYSSSIATMAVSRTVSEIHRLIGQNRPILSPLVFGAPVIGEAIGIKQRHSVMKN